MRKTFYKHLVYSAIYLIINLTAFIINAQDRQIYTYQSRREKLIWVVKDKELKSWPKVNLEKDDIPLSISKAYRNAHKYICKYYGHPTLVSVSLLPVHPESVAVRDLYFYAIEFTTGAFDSMAVVVLLNGKVLEAIKGS